MSVENNNYHPRIYQLDELIADIYDAVYTKNNKYQIKFIDLSDLNLTRFKLTDYDLDSIFDTAKIKYAGSYPTGLFIDDKHVEQINFKRDSDHQCSIRIIPYTDRNAVTDMTEPVNVNQIIKTLFSELVVSEKTSNILLPVINVDVEGSDLNEYEKVKPYIVDDKFYSIEITEKFYRMTTLDGFLKEYPLEMQVLKSILYQTIDVLYQISTSYPGFRHNQLFPEMIDCYLKMNGNIIFPEIKLGNFFISEIDELITNNASIIADIPMIDNNVYSDLYQLLNYMWNDNLANIEKYPELVKIFDALLPPKIRSKERYLTKELWNNLTDDEKNSLRIKNIRNSGFFTTKDSLLNTNFMEPTDNQTTGGQENSAMEDTSNIKKFNHDVGKKTRDDSVLNKKYSNIDIDDMSNKKNKYNDQYSDMTSDNNSDKKIKKSSVDKKSRSSTLTSDDFSLDSERENRSDNKSNDIMPEKRGTKNNMYSEKEITEERKPSKASKLINISDRDVSTAKRVSNDRQKTYSGRRKIVDPNVMNNLAGANQNSFLANQNEIPMSQNNMGNSMPSQQDHAVNVNGVPSRINSIGSLLGANTVDYTRQQNAVSQLPYQVDMNQMQAMQMPAMQMAPAMQMPAMQMPAMQMPGNQMQMAANQMPMQQNNNDALMRYLAASGMGQPQQMGQTQPQMDSALMAALMQQQSAPQAQQMAYPSGQLGGGAQRNPFFFRQ